MDESDLDLISRKKFKMNSKKLSEKISNERQKIIKVMVNQHAALTDLQRQHQICEAKCEKLQQNLLNLQTQYYELSSMYQNETKHRDETLNEVSKYQKMGDCFEECVQSLMNTISRCQSDKTILFKHFQEHTKELNILKVNNQQNTSSTILALENKLELAADREQQMSEVFNSMKNCFECQLNETKMMFETTQAKLFKHVDENNQLKVMLVSCGNEAVKMKTKLQNTVEDLLDAKNSNLKLNADVEAKNGIINELSKSIKELTEEFPNQEALTKVTNERNNELKETIVTLEQQLVTLTNNFNNLKNEHADSVVLIENLKLVTDQLNTDKKEYTRLLCEKEKDTMALIENLKSVNDQLDTAKKEYIGQLSEKEEIIAKKESELVNLKEQSEKDSAIVSGLSAAQRQLEISTETQLARMVEKIAEITQELSAKEQELENRKIAYEETLNTFAKEKEDFTTELQGKQATIESLQYEVKQSKDLCVNSDVTILNLQLDLQRERQNAQVTNEIEARRIDRLIHEVKEAQEEKAKQLDLINELQRQKEKVQGENENLQSKIRNMEKEFAGLIETGAPPKRQADKRRIVFSPYRIEALDTPIDDLLRSIITEKSNIEKEILERNKLPSKQKPNKFFVSKNKRLKK